MEARRPRGNLTAGRRERGSSYYDDEIAVAVDAFREDHGLSHRGSGGTPPGFVDRKAVDLMWQELEATGKAKAMRARIRDLTRVRR